MTISRARPFALLLFGTWALINGLAYALDSSRRYRAESAWFLLAALLVGAAVHATARGTNTPDRVPSVTRLELLLTYMLLLVFAFAQYSPVLSIGLLSDDFVLLNRAQAGIFAESGWEFLRPLPLAIWSALSQISGVIGVPVVLHAFSIGLHATNAWLMCILATRLGLDSWQAFLVALLFLVFPVSVEAVAWPSSVFDLLFVALLLAACIAITTPLNTAAVTIGIALLTVMALATKETAIVFPALLAIAAYSSRRVGFRTAILPIAISAALVLLYLPIRLFAGFDTAPPVDEVSGYAIKEMLSRPFGTLALPFHGDFLAAQRWVPFVFAIFWPALLVGSSIAWPNNRGSARTALSLTAWIFISVVPVATMLFIADDLQGSRYLYAGSAAWSLMLLVLLRPFRWALRVAVIVPLLVLFAVAVRVHQSPWIAAARERDRVLDAYQKSGLTCTPTQVRGLPDHISGAYIFRNGFAEAVLADADATPDKPACVITWDGNRFHEARE